MTPLHPAIRPSPARLRSLPTLDVITPPHRDNYMIAEYLRGAGLDFNLELKGITADYFYLLCVRVDDGPKNTARLCAGEAIQENRVLDELQIYNQAHITALQREDYVRMLMNEYFTLHAADQNADALQEIADEMAVASKEPEQRRAYRPLPIL